MEGEILANENSQSLIQSQLSASGVILGFFLRNQQLTHNQARTEASRCWTEKARIGAQGLEAHGTFYGTPREVNDSGLLVPRFTKSMQRLYLDTNPCLNQEWSEIRHRLHTLGWRLAKQLHDTQS